MIGFETSTRYCGLFPKVPFLWLNTPNSWNVYNWFLAFEYRLLCLQSQHWPRRCLIVNQRKSPFSRCSPAPKHKPWWTECRLGPSPIPTVTPMNSGTTIGKGPVCSLSPAASSPIELNRLPSRCSLFPNLNQHVLRDLNFSLALGTQHPCTFGLIPGCLIQALFPVPTLFYLALCLAITSCHP
jgi:hypothetical protein